MKIKNVEVVNVNQSLWGSFWEAQRKAPSSTPLSRYKEYAGSLDSWWWPQAMVLVRIEASNGVSGIGWAEDGTGAAANVINTHFKQLLIGKDPSEIIKIWDVLFRASIPYGRKGVAIEALSAVDIALWDLKGKQLNVPVYKLLGGTNNEGMKTYASHLQPVEMDLFKEEAKAYAEEGYQAMKMRMPGNPKHGLTGINRNVERIEAIREAVGHDIEIMADAYMGWDLRFAKRMMDAIKPYNVSWIEEPLLPDELEMYSELCRYSSVPISHGENEFTRYGFAQIIWAKAANILQPDVHRVGGITEIIRVAHLAEVAGLEIVPHAFSAPTVHAMAAIPNCRMLEVLTIPVWARDKIKELPPVILGEPKSENGTVYASNDPGLGVKINCDLLPNLKHWND